MSAGGDLLHLGRHRVNVGDCVAWLRTLPDASIDAVVTDPPYGFGFMGRAWDGTVPGADVWTECLRVLRPGGHLVAFGGSRTWHRLAVAVEDAGFEIRDCLTWLYGSGFPKSLDVGKAIDKAAGAKRDAVRVPTRDGNSERRGAGDQGATFGDSHGGFRDVSTPATPEAARWDGWGTALKPAVEFGVLARKPLVGTVAANVLAHGTGALNIDGCRVATDEDRRRNARGGDNGMCGSSTFKIRERRADDQPVTAGRFPPNLLHDGSPEVLSAFGVFGDRVSGGGNKRSDDSGMWARKRPFDFVTVASTGTAARFFPACELSPDDLRFHYTAKASRAERAGARHATVKPLSLMRWLVRLLTPSGGIVLDPFLGSGTTLLAAEAEGMTCWGAEMGGDPTDDDPTPHVTDILRRWEARESIIRWQERRDAARAPKPAAPDLFGCDR